MQYCTVACFISALANSREPDHDCEDMSTVLIGVFCAAHVSLWDSFLGVEFLLGVDSVPRDLRSCPFWPVIFRATKQVFGNPFT